MDAVRAEEEFRWGVQAFNNGFFNKAILSFEKSLTFKPNDPKTKEWLGKAYYRSGFEEAALRIWQTLIDSQEAGALLRNKVDTIQYRRGFGEEVYRDDRFVLASTLEAAREDYKLFSRPTSITARPDGSFYVVAFGSNEIILFNVNGALERRLRGGLQGFDHPFDVVETENGDLFITEFAGNRITRSDNQGYIRYSFGKLGEGGGTVIGPQYIADDGEGYLYVTDWGNRQVCKFNYEGDFILSFGKKTSFFEGLSAPSGIIVHRQKVFVADSVEKCIFVFDLSGNYITTLAQDRLTGPEDIALLEDGVFLISDSQRIVTFDLDKELVTTVTDIENRADKILSSVIDANGNLLAVDFNREQIFILSKLSSLYSGYTVSIDRVFSEDYPHVQFSVLVENRKGDPIVGFDNRNFIITENHRPANNLSFEFASHKAEAADIAFVIEKSPEMKTKQAKIVRAMTVLSQELQGRGTAALISAGEQPVMEAESGANVMGVLGRAIENGFSSDWQFDLGIRMAVSELIPSRNKRAIIYVASGESEQPTFHNYSLAETMQYMKNNGIVFYCVYLDQTQKSEEFDYLCRETGGDEFYLYEPKGIGRLIERILSQKSGVYVFTYSSSAETNFGEAFIPLEAEVFLYKKSGRDESGYFAPLEF